MTGDFELHVDPKRKLLRVTMSGFFDAPQIMRMAQAVVTTFRQHGFAPDELLTLVDIRQMDIQSQDAVQQFQDLLSTEDTRSRRLAFIVARSLARLQIKRAASHREAEYFEDEASAEAWIAAELEEQGREEALSAR